MGYTQPFMNVRKVGILTSLIPATSTSGDELKIFANTTDGSPYIWLRGNNYILLDFTNSLYFSAAGTSTFVFTKSGNDAVITNPINDGNLSLLTTGAGKIKFGTFTGSGDVACNGSIAIVDAAGNARKLMTTA